jgi:choice-of-anchor A domain-containing protein
MAIAPAHASALSAAAILGQFNAVVFGDFSSTAVVGGLTLVGGNLVGGASFDINPGSLGMSSFSGLTVYGSATNGGNYNINNGGGVTIAGANNATFSLNGGGSAYIGGGNTGALNANSSAALTIGGVNSGTLQIASGGSVFVGGSNSGGINANGGASIAINGNNSANMNLNGGGTVAVNGSNSGTVSLNGGTFTYVGNQTGNLNLNGGAQAIKATSLTLTAPASTLASFASTYQAPLTSLSTQLDTLAANSIATSANQAIAFNARPDATGTAVFDINSSFLTTNSTVTINLDGATSVIINVNVDSCVSASCVFSLPNSLNFANPTGYASNVLWNFVNATGLTFPNEIGGSVLAPLAAVTNNAPIDGTLVANSYAGNGELRSYPFTGSLPNGSTTPVSGGSAGVAVTEPGSLTLVAAALSALFLVRRRGARAASAERRRRAA